MGGCGCAVVGDESSSNNAAWLLALGMVGAALRLARRRSDKPTKANPSNPEVRA
jgi:MYXO-CTERM domain-containing protein